MRAQAETEVVVRVAAVEGAVMTAVAREAAVMLVETVAVEMEAEAPAAIEATETAGSVSWRFATLEMDSIPEEEDEDGVEHEDEDGVEDEEEDEVEDEVDDEVEAEAAEMQDVGAKGAPDIEMDVQEIMCTSPSQWGVLFAPLSVGLFRSNSHLALATAVVAIEPVPPCAHPDPQ